MNQWKIEKDKKMILILGNEHKGVDQLIREKVDLFVEINYSSLVNQTPYNVIDSLNVSVAAALAMHKLKENN